MSTKQYKYELLNEFKKYCVVDKEFHLTFQKFNVLHDFKYLINFS